MSTTATPAKNDKSHQITLIGVRLSYPALFEPKAMEGSEGNAKYSANLILDKEKDAKQIEKIEALITAIYKEKNKGVKLKADRICLKDGDDKAGKEGYGDHVMFISASNTRKPQVVDSNANGRSPLDKNDSRIFGGCYVNAVVNLWWQDNKFGKRVNASLEAVQYSRPGEPFGAPPVDTDEAFGGIEDEEEVDHNL